MRQLLREADSYELSAWQAFFTAEAEYREDRRQSAELEARMNRR